MEEAGETGGRGKREQEKARGCALHRRREAKQGRAYEWDPDKRNMYGELSSRKNRRVEVQVADGPLGATHP